MSEGPWTQYQSEPVGPWAKYSSGGELKEFKKESRQDVLEALPMVGSIGGGIAGFATGGPVGSLVGTGAGASIGTSAKQIIEQFGGKKMETREILGEQFNNVSEQMFYDLIGFHIGAGLSATLKAVSPEVRSGAVEAQAALKKHGGSLSASQYYESSTLQLGESFSRAGAGGKGQFIALEKRNADAIDAIKNNLIASISKDPVNDRVAGKLFQSAIEKGDDLHKIASTAMYKQFDTRAGNILVDLATPVKLADGTKTSARLLGIELAEQVEKGLLSKSEAGGRVIDQLQKVGKTISFSDAHSMRSSLLALVRDLRETKADSVALRNAARAASLVDKAMETAANNLAPSIQKEYREISKFYRTGKEAFSNDVITTLMKEKPERVGEYLFKSGNVSEITQAKASLRYAHQFDPTIDPKRLYDRLQAGYLNQLLTSKAAVNVEGEVTAKNLMKELANAKTDRQFAVMFTPRERAQIAEFGRTAYLTLMNKPSQFGVLAPILQAGAVGDLLISGARIGTDVALLGAPYGLGKLLSNADATKILIDAMKMPEVMLTGPVVAKLTAEMNKAMEKE